MARDLARLLNPESVALFGGAWAENVIAQLKKTGYAGEIWPVHPKRNEINGIACFRSIADLPSAPDAAFIGVNREASIEVIGELSRIGAGGATCFASGFSESDGEGSGGGALQARLVEAAGEMPILGPNCYGMLNYLDNVALWPDQHGGQRCDRGVGIIAQSSNIAINMTMQKRGLPIAYMVAAGNQAQTGISEIAEAMLADERVSVIGLYLEGFGDIRALEAFAKKARNLGKSVVVLKIGRSNKAQLATMTHTASMAGNAAVSSALLKRLGFIEVRSIAVFLETLKLLHFTGRLNGNAICSVSCSGGEASLIADLAERKNIDFRDFTARQSKKLKHVLGPIVTIANPLDYHTFIWGDVPKMTEVFKAVMEDGFDLCVFILDIPRDDRCDPSSFECAIDAIIGARNETGAKVAVLASLPENISEEINERFSAAGVVILNGMEEGLSAIDHAIQLETSDHERFSPLLLAPVSPAEITMLDEAASKNLLTKSGVKFPNSVSSESIEALVESASKLCFPLALKGLGIAHKSEAGAVILNIADATELGIAAKSLANVTGYLAEEMVPEPVAEILVGITRDASGLFMLTIGAGGVMAELIDDTANLLLPVRKQEIQDALANLKLTKILNGYRGNPAADLDALVEQVMGICEFAETSYEGLVELDVNPLMACVDRCVAVDALIGMQKEGC